MKKVKNSTFLLMIFDITISKYTVHYTHTHTYTHIQGYSK